MSLMVGSSAAGGIKSLDGLLSMMGKSGGGKQVVLAAMEALQVRGLQHLCVQGGGHHRWGGVLGPHQHSPTRSCGG